METINITLKIEREQVLNFENWLRNNLEIVDFAILPNTNKLYEKDSTFKKLVKAVKDAKRVKDIYINDHNYEQTKS